MEELTTKNRRKNIRNMFSRIAPKYDLMNSLMTLGLHHAWRRTVAKIATKELNGIALDVATGTGDLVFALHKSTRCREVIGIDLVPEMISIAKKKSLYKSASNNVHFLLGDALSLPFFDNVFSCVTSAWGLRNMPDLRSSLKEMIRVTRPGGLIVSLESMPFDKGFLNPLLRFGFQHLIPLMGHIVAHDKDAYTYLPRSADRFLTMKQLSVLFQELGLQDISCKRLGFGAVGVHWGTKPLQ